RCPRGAKIDEFDAPGWGQADIMRFDVAVCRHATAETSWTLWLPSGIRAHGRFFVVRLWFWRRPRFLLQCWFRFLRFHCWQGVCQRRCPRAFPLRRGRLRFFWFGRAERVDDRGEKPA